MRERPVRAQTARPRYPASTVARRRHNSGPVRMSSCRQPAHPLPPCSPGTSAERSELARVVLSPGARAPREPDRSTVSRRYGDGVVPDRATERRQPRAVRADRDIRRGLCLGARARHSTVDQTSSTVHGGVGGVEGGLEGSAASSARTSARRRWSRPGLGGSRGCVRVGRWGLEPTTGLIKSLIWACPAGAALGL